MSQNKLNGKAQPKLPCETAICEDKQLCKTMPESDAGIKATIQYFPAQRHSLTAERQPTLPALGRVASPPTTKAVPGSVGFLVVLR